MSQFITKFLNGGIMWLPRKNNGSKWDIKCLSPQRKKVFYSIVKGDTSKEEKGQKIKKRQIKKIYIILHVKFIQKNISTIEKGKLI